MDVDDNLVRAQQTGRVISHLEMVGRTLHQNLRHSLERFLHEFRLRAHIELEAARLPLWDLACSRRKHEPSVELRRQIDHLPAAFEQTPVRSTASYPEKSC